MAKNAIFQYYLNYNGIGKQSRHYPTEGMPEWAEYSVAHFKEYAKKHDADHHFMTDRFVESRSNYFEVTRIFKDPIFDQYENVLYCDVDVMPKNMDANVFNLPVIDVAGWPEYRHPDITAQINWQPSGPLTQRFAHFGAPIIPAKSTNAPLRMINSGVMLWSKQARLKARELFVDHEEWFEFRNAWLDKKWVNVGGHSSHCLDQPYMNAMWSRHNFDVLELGIEWNRFPTRNEDYPCNFAHYVNDSRYQIPKIFKDLR